MGKTKILHINTSLDIGGIESLLINLLRNVDKSKYQYDFLLFCKNESYYEKEAKKYGANVYKLNLSKNPIINIFKTKKFLKNHSYDVVHSHTLFYSGFFVFAAKLAGVKIRVVHMHSTSDNAKKSFIRKVYKKITKTLIKKYSTHLCACSIDAAKYGFDSKADKAIIINNGIDSSKYVFEDAEKINKLRKKYGIKKSDFILGNVGHLSIEKNQKFIINIVEILINYKSNIKCLFVGNGSLRQELSEMVKQKKLDDYIIFVGETNEVNNYLKLMNIFLFPSLYEGFGLALLEAQAAGIHSLSSDTVPKNTDMELELVKYLPIDDEKLWINEILNISLEKVDENLIYDALIKKGFDINNSLKQLNNIYGIKSGDVDE